MAVRLEIGLRPELPDPAGQGLMKKARQYLGLRLAAARVLRVLTLDCPLAPEQQGQAADLLSNPVTEVCSYQPLAHRLLPGWDWALWVGYRPGVRDNEGATALAALADELGRQFSPDKAVYCSRLYLLKAPRLTAQQAETICRQLLANELINQWQVIARPDWDDNQGIGLRLPKVELHHRPKVDTLPVDSDQELIALSDQRGLFLNPADVPVIRAYFNDPQVLAERAEVGLGPPTDVELEYISQARSDHCNHNTFNGRFFYEDLLSGETAVVANLFKETIKEPTERLAAQRDWVVSVLWDNAGVARLDQDYNYVITGETHNSPSNMEAYGGAITGIVGVYRDPMGTGLGAKLVAGMWGYCVGPRDYAGPLNPALHPRRLLDGVIEGVRDGGNKSGIPTTGGLLYFDPRYLGKCLVFVSALGVMPRQVAGRSSHQKKPRPGDLVIMCGGRVGVDGIHGVTASSAGYSASTPAGHVQIGDPYTQKKMSDFLLEARDAGLVQFITDNGGGGLSSSVGESARLSPGAQVDLAAVPLKYQGLDPWQIWVSESQERMTVAVDPAHREPFMALAAKHAVEATVIGRFSGDGRLRLTYGDEVCCHMDVALAEKGFKQWQFDAHWLPPAARGLNEPVIGEPPDLGPLLLELLDSPNLCSREWINRQYDHEVQGTSVIKPFVGRGRDLPAEAAVILPVLESGAGLAMAQVLLPGYGDIDTYHMVTASVEEALRRVTAVGGDPSQAGGVDNFCWPSVIQHDQNNPDGRYKAAQLVRACWGLRDACLALGIPVLSGKDSMYVDGTLRGSQGQTQRVSGPPTMMFSATAPVPSLARCQTLEPKLARDLLYILGATGDELGGGALYNLLGYVGRKVPQADFAHSLKLCQAVSRALDRGLCASLAVPSSGGLAYALARMVMAADLGLDVALDDMPLKNRPLSAMRRLFSETGGRLLVTVDPGRRDEFESLLEDVPFVCLGRVCRRRRLKVSLRGQPVLDLGRQEMRRTFGRRFGGLI